MPGHALADCVEHAFHVLGQRVADGVGQVDRGGTGADRRLGAAAEEVDVAARRVLGRPLHVIGMLACQGDGIDGGGDHLVGLHAQLVFHVQRAGGDDDVDAPTLCRAKCLGGAQHIHVACAREAGDHRGIVALADAFGDRLDAFEIAHRGDGEAGFQHIDAQLGQRLGHADLLVDVHREAGRLLAVAQRGVEDDDAVVFQLAEAGMLDAHLGRSLD